MVICKKFGMSEIVNVQKKFCNQLPKPKSFFFLEVNISWGQNSSESIWEIKLICKVTIYNNTLFRALVSWLGFGTPPIERRNLFFALPCA